MYILKRSTQKLKSIFSRLWHYPIYYPTFYNFTLKIETSWAEKVVKSILENSTVIHVIVYVWFNYFWIKKNKYAI